MKLCVNDHVLASVLFTRLCLSVNAADIEAVFHKAPGSKDTGAVRTLGRTRTPNTRNLSSGTKSPKDGKSPKSSKSTSVTKSPKSNTSTSKSTSKDTSATKSPKSTKSSKTSNQDFTPTATPTSTPTGVPTTSFAPTSNPTAAPTSAPTAFCDTATDATACGRLQAALAAQPAFNEFFDRQDDTAAALIAAYSNPTFLNNIEAAASSTATFFVGTAAEIYSECSSTSGATCCSDENVPDSSVCVFDGVAVMASDACVGEDACDLTANMYGTRTMNYIGSNVIFMPGSCTADGACQGLHAGSAQPTFVGENACSNYIACYDLGVLVNGVVSVGRYSCTERSACGKLGQKTQLDATTEYIVVGEASCTGTFACLSMHADSSGKSAGTKTQGSVRIEGNACAGTSSCASVGRSDDFIADLVVQSGECNAESECQNCVQGQTCPGETFYASALSCGSATPSDYCL